MIKNWVFLVIVADFFYYYSSQAEFKRLDAPVNITLNSNLLSYFIGSIDIYVI